VKGRVDDRLGRVKQPWLGVVGANDDGTAARFPASVSESTAPSGSRTQSLTSSSTSCVRACALECQQRDGAGGVARVLGTDFFGEVNKVLGVACAGGLLENSEDQEDRDEDLDRGAAGVVLVQGLDVARDVSRGACRT
jgi:hypothetical protein